MSITYEYCDGYHHIDCLVKDIKNIDKYISDIGDKMIENGIFNAAVTLHIEFPDRPEENYTICAESERIFKDYGQLNMFIYKIHNYFNRMN